MPSSAQTRPSARKLVTPRDFHYDLRSFCEFDQFTATEIRRFDGADVRAYGNEFWTSKQRAGHSLHEISYRACYKPQLPAFFISRFCEPEDVVYDPFMGRGTTLIEAQLHGARAMGNDVNPLSRVLAAPRLEVPGLNAIGQRLTSIRLPAAEIEDTELLVFFEAETLRELYGWRTYFSARRAAGTFDPVDAWIEMVACNRLTGHSKGFFSVYTLPPNQATSVAAQRKINEKRNQQPEYRDTRSLILRKSRSLLRDPLPRHYNRGDAELLNESADATPQIPDNSVKLVVTSPPFLDTVDYVQDNWLRTWFCGANFPRKRLWQMHSTDDWLDRMTDTFRELRRVLRADGLIAFEVGEVRKGKLLLENEVVKAGMEAGLAPECIMINAQNFTKTANCWGVNNNTGGTNTNRIVLLRKE